jgi:hypothetical protein
MDDLGFNVHQVDGALVRLRGAERITEVAAADSLD